MPQGAIFWRNYEFVREDRLIRSVTTASMTNLTWQNVLHWCVRFQSEAQGGEPAVVVHFGRLSYCTSRDQYFLPPEQAHNISRANTL